MYTPWIWTRMLHACIITGSHSSNLSLKLSLKCRDIIICDKYKRTFPHIRLRGDQSSKSDFMNTGRGEKMSTSVTSNIMGNHGHFIIVDDPMDPKESLSEVQRETANDWMSGTLSSRKKDQANTPTILIMQRLHENDCTADMIERIKEARRIAIKEGNEVAPLRLKHICLPAEVSNRIKPKQLTSYYKDGLMDPIKLPQEVLSEKKVKEYFYAGQFEQWPVPIGGGMFKIDRIKIDVSDGKWNQLVRFWDKAGTEGGTGAFTVGLLMGKDREGRFWILDIIRGRWDSAKRESIIRQTAMIDGKNVIIGVEQEPGSGGKESAQATVRNLAGWTVIVDKPSGADSSKIQRADPFSTQVNSSNVSMIKAEWNLAFLGELGMFDKGKYKDQVDASSGAFNILTGRIRRAGPMFRKSTD